MFCFSCQKLIQRKLLDDYFKHTTLCVKCNRFKHSLFEESELPFHHFSLTFKYSSIFKNTVLETRMAEDILKTQGDVLKLTNNQEIDALALVLSMEFPFYLNEYLTLNFIAYIKYLETIPVVLITA